MQKRQSIVRRMSRVQTVVVRGDLNKLLTKSNQSTPKPKRSPGRFQMLKKRNSTEDNLALDGFISKQESIDSD